MKKLVTLILLSLIFSSFFASADESTEVINSVGDNSTNPLDKIKDLGDSVPQDFLSKEFTIPSTLQFPARIIFGINEETILWRDFIVIISFWIALLMIITIVIGMTPLHKESSGVSIIPISTDFIIALIVTIIISLTGSIALVTKYWLSFIDMLLSFLGLAEFVKKSKILSTILAIVVFIALIFGARFLSKHLRRNLRREQSDYEGENIHTLGEMAEAQSKALDKL